MLGFIGIFFICQFFLILTKMMKNARVYVG